MLRFLIPALLLLGCQSADTAKIATDGPPDPVEDAGRDGASAIDASSPHDAHPDAFVQPDAYVPPDAPPECTGASCVDDGNPCTQNLCINGHCQYPNQNDGLACHDATSGHDGRCYSGACCVGCWNGGACVTGTSLDECGSSGHVCLDCDDSKECTADTCLSVSNACTHSNRSSGTPCSDGTCGSGANAGVCVMASSPVCGGAGEDCCSGFTCNQSGTTCNFGTNKCEYCGAEDQLCCLVGGVYACGDPTHLTCKSEAGGTEFCRCGGEGEACCNSAISPCDAPLQCNAGTCFHP